MKNNKSVTAVEWLESKMYVYGINPNTDLFKQAKEIEKEQMIDAFDKGDFCIDLPDGTWEQKYKSGEQYYNETFVKNIPTCLNCKFAGEPFDLGATPHIYCNHPNAKAKVDCGEFEPLDTLMEGSWLCGLHEFTPQTPDQ